MERRRNQNIQIRLEKVSYIESGKTILDNVSLTIEEHRTYLLVGRNGSGKSTLLKLLSGIIQPTNGKIYSNGNEIADSWQLREKVGIVFQNPLTQIIGATVEEDIAFGLENLGIDPMDIENRIEETLRIVGMEDLRDKDPIELSGGLLQRLAIASIITLQPEILLLDEPLSMLDKKAKRDIANLLKTFHGKKTMVIATHEYNYFPFADKVIYMEKGQAYIDDFHKFFENILKDFPILKWI